MSVIDGTALQTSVGLMWIKREACHNLKHYHRMVWPWDWKSHEITAILPKDLQLNVVFQLSYDRKPTIGRDPK